jgi:hypothetical protein
MQRTEFLHCIFGSQPSVPRRYKVLKQRVQNAVGRYSLNDTLVYLRGFTHASYN